MFTHFITISTHSAVVDILTGTNGQRLLPPYEVFASRLSYRCSAAYFTNWKVALECFLHPQRGKRRYGCGWHRLYLVKVTLWMIFAVAGNPSITAWLRPSEKFKYTQQFCHMTTSFIGEVGRRSSLYFPPLLSFYFLMLNTFERLLWPTFIC